MPHNPHRIPKRPSDSGTAEQINDVRRGTNFARNNGGAVVGPSARVTGSIITTSDDAVDGKGAGVYMAGSSGPQGQGIFATDTTGAVVMELLAGGLVVYDTATPPHAVFSLTTAFGFIMNWPNSTAIAIRMDTDIGVGAGTMAGMIIYEHTGTIPVLTLDGNFGLILYNSQGQSLCALIPNQGLVLHQGRNTEEGVHWDNNSSYIQAYGDGKSSASMDLVTGGVAIEMKGETDDGLPRSVKVRVGGNTITLQADDNIMRVGSLVADGGIAATGSIASTGDLLSEQGIIAAHLPTSDPGPGNKGHFWNNGGVVNVSGG